MEALPTPLREHAYDDLTGRGVVIAFLDGGFTAHPDLARPESRILHYEDLTGEGVPLESATREGAADLGTWHGTQTSVVGAGNGFLSDGRFRSLAPDSKVVLLRVVARDLVVEEEQVARGLEWVLAHHERLGIRVVNVSVGAGQETCPFEWSRVDRLAEEAVARGIVVVAAAGNRGASEDPQPIPPANAPSVIAAGGYDDHERVADPDPDLYWESSFGITPDGLLKPEVLGPAVGVAAPLLTGTRIYEEAEAAVRLAETPASRVREVMRQVRRILGLPAESRDWPPEVLWEEAWKVIEAERVVGAHYREVNGTSFAAPIVSSIVAQMLEANPRLTPAAVKQILICSAERLHGVPMERQGFGRVNARRAVDLARRVDRRETARHGLPALHHGRLVFHFHALEARQVEVLGDFDGWALHPMHACSRGFWRVAVPVPGPGRYRYKFHVDEREWLQDPANLHVEPDGYGGLNSLLEVR